MSLNSKYIEDQYIGKLINYKYKGGDDSILCYYVINPFCEFIVNYFPLWLAPNVITISGWFFNLFNLIITTYYTGWKGGYYIPPLASFACAFFYTTYIILDYSDGKQARRLNASTPLGLLVDHGTDACTTFYVTVVTGSIMYCSNMYQYLLLYFPLSCTFFINTWEEYYVGELVLPEINGVAEGTLLIDIIHIISAIYGRDFFLKEIFLFKGTKLQVNDLIAIGAFFGGLIFSIKSVIGVCQKVKKEKLGRAFKDTIIYILFFIALLSITFLNGGNYIKDLPRFVILTFGFQFAKMLGMLQLAHILCSPYNVYKFVFLFPLMVMLIHSIIYYFFDYEILVSIDQIILITFFWNFLSWLHFVYFCSEQICDILNINRFSLGKRNPDRPSYEEIKSKVNSSD